MGVRDRAVLGLLIGCSLRRDELANLTFATCSSATTAGSSSTWSAKDDVCGLSPCRAGRKCSSIAGLPKLISHTAPSFGVSERAAGSYTRRHPTATRNRRGCRQTPWPTWSRPTHGPLGWDLAPHHLRRTFAKLARSGQAPLEQIQLALGHQNIQTTQRYLGSELDLADAACDRLGIRLER
jgi:integrase